tara:strand:+ start:84 stop:329 length:246 start_codon:yes stop_codon:yes gene_type:complete
MSNDIEAGTHVDLTLHRKPDGVSEKFAYVVVKVLRFFAGKFFANRYGNRGLVLETVAAVPAMVGGLLMHLKALRSIRDDEG